MTGTSKNRLHANHLAAVIMLVCGSPVDARETMPGEVMEFIAQRTLCDHFRGEPWPEGNTAEEQERRVFLSRQVEHYCTGTDQNLRQLRERYRDDEEVLQQLNSFESTVETR